MRRRNRRPAGKDLRVSRPQQVRRHPLRGRRSPAANPRPTSTTTKMYGHGSWICMPRTSRLWRPSCRTSICRCGRALLIWLAMDPARFCPRVDLTHSPAVAGVFAEPTPHTVPESVSDRRPLGTTSRPLKLAESNRRGARRASPDSHDGERSRRSSGRGSKPARLRRHRRTSATKGFLSANRCLLCGHPASRHAVNQHFVARQGDTSVVVEVLEAEIPVRVRDDAGIEHRPRDDGRPPRTDVGAARSWGVPSGGTIFTV